MKTIDLLLVYPKPTSDSPVKLTPLSILFPGALFTEQGLEVNYYDERFDSQEELVELIIHSREIGVSSFTGYQSGRAAAILRLAKEINPRIVTGVGGHHARLQPQQVINEPFVDKVWKESSYGEHLFPYNKKTRVHFERTDMQYFTSRGCPFSCAFCAISSPWIPKRIDDIDRELKAIHSDIGFKEISFSDPNIAYGLGHKVGPQGTNEERVKRIRQIGKIMRDLNVRWDGNMRATYLTSQMVEALNEANCYSLEIGCESGNDYFLRRVIRKGHGVDSIKQAALNVSGSSISVMYSFVANMPGETPQMRLDTMDLIDWITATDPNARISIYSYAPYPGSRMFDMAVRGEGGYKKFIPPQTMEGWANLRLMNEPIYWIAGLCFRLDNTQRNFPGNDWALIAPYVELAQKKWKDRDIDDFPCQEVEMLIKNQFQKRDKSYTDQVVP